MSFELVLGAVHVMQLMFIIISYFVTSNTNCVDLNVNQANLK